MEDTTLISWVNPTNSVKGLFAILFLPSLLIAHQYSGHPELMKPVTIANDVDTSQPGVSEVVTDVDTEEIDTEADWPMWQYDPARSADTPHILPEKLHLHWIRELPRPQRAWRHQWDNQDKLDFDVSYTPVVMGKRIFVPSNAADNVTAYNIEDGSRIWQFYADGPVRLAPVAWKGKVYFVSDDGYLYCVNAETGQLVWKFAGGPSAHHLLGNERIINFWPARGGPVIKDGAIYFTAGIWPLHGIFIYALDAESGEVIWVNDTTSSDYVQLPHGGASGYGGLAPQGYIAASDDRLVIAGGRTPPVFVNRHTGRVEDFSFRAKPEGGYAVHANGIGFIRNEMLEVRAAALEHLIEGEVFYKLAAQNRLFIVTDDGTLYCFGSGEVEPMRYKYQPKPLKSRTNDHSRMAADHILDEYDGPGGYALLLGAGSGDLLRELLVRSEMHITAVESNAEKVQLLRDELVEGGFYGRRAVVIEADPAAFSIQPYLFSAVIVEDIRAAGIHADSSGLENILNRLRPYGGVAWLGAPSRILSSLYHAALKADVDQVTVEIRENHLFASRGGPLKGAGQWTHQYSDPSNTNFSPDQLVKAPLGILWFGGPDNHNILPRHGQGPVPQISRGKVILPGPETISARCVYTGRELWEREFPGIGHPFTDLDKEERYLQGESVFMQRSVGLGANHLGSPFVSRHDGIYVRYRTRIYRLAPETGDVMDVFQLPVDAHLEGTPDWGYIGIRNHLLITTVEPQVFDHDDYSKVFRTMADIKSGSWDATSSKRLVAMDRHSGEVLWTREAGTGLRHNAIVTGGGNVYVIDGLSEGAVLHLQRRGRIPGKSKLMALDLNTGEVQWIQDSNIFGTWLGYSEDHDVLIQGGRQRGWHSLDDEPDDRIAALRGHSGEVMWDVGTARYHGPLSIRKDKLYLAPFGSSGQGRALYLSSGEQVMREQPVTGERAEWTYDRRYGCNSHNISEHLITFRSGYAGFFDLEHDSGTGVFGGFRAGCTNNLVAADGVLNAPDYTRTCTCSYAHQTSLALIHMPGDSNIEAWTRYRGSTPNPEFYGINFGAPGRRVDGAGRIWHDEPGTHRRHPSAVSVDNGSIDWVAASGSEMDDKNQIMIDALPANHYVVRLHFAELEAGVVPGQRVFDVLINGNRVLHDYDIVAGTGECFRGITEEVVVEAGGIMIIELKKSPDAVRDPFINGIEITAATR